MYYAFPRCLTYIWFPHTRLFYNSTIEIFKHWKVVYNVKIRGPVTIVCSVASQTSFGARWICVLVFPLAHCRWEMKVKKKIRIPVCIFFLFRFNRYKINLQSTINAFKHLFSISVLNSLQTGNSPWTTMVHGPPLEHHWIRSHMTSFYLLSIKWVIISSALYVYFAQLQICNIRENTF